MRLSLALLIIGFVACTKGGGGLKSSSGRTTGSFGGFETEAGNSSSGQSAAAVAGVSMKYAYPNVPTEEDDLQYYITTFADTSVGPLKPKEVQIQLSGKSPPQQIRIDSVNASDGSRYCFSNDKYVGGPNCKGAAANVVNHIKENQKNPTGKHPVFISALKFNFKNAPKADGGFYSEVYFEGAYVEKAPIVISKSSGNQKTINDSDLIKISYGTGGASCNLNEANTVGFEAPTYMNREFYLSGIWSYERSQRAKFETDSPAQEARICQTEGIGQYFCNLFADRVDVWHSMVLPILYTNGKKSFRQFPGQTIKEITETTKCFKNVLLRSNDADAFSVVRGRDMTPDEQDSTYPSGGDCVTGLPSTAKSTFGHYAGDTGTAGYVSTPKGAPATVIIGQTDSNGNVLKNSNGEIVDWQRYYIRKLCIKGYRLEKDAANDEIKTPLISAMRVELRAPRIKTVN